jgi:Asp-tRNA(Asn)/Glu-tRNA(Gln) amidotransferase A subunit family amidase
MKTAVPPADIIGNLRLWEPHIHAFVAVGEPPADQSQSGPLSGLSVGIKDIIDVAGLPTRNGSDACRDAPPAVKDAPSVAALRHAGARIIGKTTTTEFAFTDPTTCRNPHDLNRSPGGSSSGSGAAVAAGVVDIALGTQTAGSLCRPAAYCGVVGFKPTHGVLSTAGVTPLAPSFDSVGIIARSVALARAAFQSMAPAAVAIPHDNVKTAYFGCWTSDIVPSSDTMDALRGASHAISDLGLSASSGDLKADIDRIVTAHRTVMNFEAAAAHGPMLEDERVDFLKPKFLAGLRAGAQISHKQAEEAAAYLSVAQQAFWRSLKGIDFILTLPVPEGAPLIDGTTGYQDWLTPWTVFGGPLICLPWGLDTLGRPRSVMLAGPPGMDAQLLEVAAQLEDRSPPFARPQKPSF